MSVWPQVSFSQRATWPPSATVRQRSIALITFSWSRLTWPRLASRQAGPWSRKISATSRAGRTMRAAQLRRLGLTPLSRPLVRAAELRERALDGSDPARGHARVACRRVQLVVAEQSLDQPDIGAALEQMRSKAVAQRMQADALLDAGSFSRLMEQAAELARGQMQSPSASGEEPALLWRHACI